MLQLRLWNRLRKVRLRDALVTLVALAALAVVEVVGRSLHSVAGDLLCGGWLVLIGFHLAVAHRRSPIGWLATLLNSGWGLLRRIRRHIISVGVDLREQPSVSGGLPPILLYPAAALTVVAALLLALPATTGVSDRTWAAACYVLYLAGKLLLWGLLSAEVLLLTLMVPRMCRDLLLLVGPAAHLRRRPMPAGSRFSTALSLVALPLAWWFPVGIALAVCLVALLLELLAFTVGPHTRLLFLWRSTSSGGHRSLSWRMYAGLCHTLFSLCVLIPLLAAIGPAGWSLSVAAAPPSATTAIGRCVAWLAACNLVCWSALSTYLLVRFRIADPSVPCPVTVRLAGGAADEQRQAAEMIRSSGWKLRSRGPIRNTDVHLTLDQYFTADNLARSAVRERLLRRDELQRRRVLTRALASMLRGARSGTKGSGVGLWVAPQHWFIGWLSRDSDDRRRRSTDQTEIMDGLPPPFYRAIPLPARQHWHAVCSALQIDLIFLEDRVPLQGLKRVMRMMFEHYDIHGGRRRIEEVHFTGIPRVKVVIVDFEIGRSWTSTAYPEPDYEDISRARVLHIFRDRGEAFEHSDPPSESDDLPVDWTDYSPSGVDHDAPVLTPA